MPPAGDALLAFRRSILAKQSPTTTLEPPSDTQPGTPEPDLTKATHLQFNHAGLQTFPLSAPTRVEIEGETVDLRSIYFMWLKNDISSVDYNSECARLTQELSKEGNAGGKVTRILFGEKAEIIAWLDGADDCSYITPLSPEAQKVQDEVDRAGQAARGAEQAQRPRDGVVPGLDPKLKEIYSGERRMGDRNSVLRGIKPTDFSHIRKHAELFLGRNARTSRNNQPPTKGAPANLSNRSKANGPTAQPTPPDRNREPIILLSPSASSLLRLSNIKPFLDGGVYTPADSTAAASNLLYIQRLLPGIDPQRPLRFILVDSCEGFKPDYWSRVVAVFTTGQTWQFKSYMWSHPPELFSHALGVYVGWRGEDVPGTVKGWGRGVMSTMVDKYNPTQGAQARWRDREVVEGIWTAIEESMRGKGWGKDVGR